MAGYDLVYYLGPDGYDGLNPIDLEILVGSSDRQWFEARYFTPALKPMGGIRVVIANTLEPREALLRAMIVLAPDLFAECPSLRMLRNEIEAADGERYEFPGLENSPGWRQLLAEAKPVFDKLPIYRARLEPINVRK